MDKKENKGFNWRILARVLQNTKPYKFRFVTALILTVVLAFLSPVRPILIGDMIDVYVINNDRDGLFVMFVVVATLILFESILYFAQTYLSTWVAQSITMDLRASAFRQVSGYKLKYFDKTPVGTLVTRLVSDIDGIANMFSNGVLTIIGEVLKLIVITAVMFYTNWVYALCVIIPVPLLLIATRIFKNAIKKAFVEVRNQVGALNVFVQEHISGMTLVQAFVSEERENEKFIDLNKKHRNAHIKSVWAYSIFFPIVEILSALSIAFLIWGWVGNSTLENVSVGEFTVFTFFVFMIYRPIRMLADRFNELQMGIVNAERVFQVLDLNEKSEDNGDVSANLIKGDIAFENIWFAYNEEEYVLKDISFHVSPGESVAFVGATGAGKTSIINLISRLYEYQKGEIKIDNISLESYDLDSLRRKIVIVNQDVFLFSDSIFNNITLNNSTISKQQVVEAAKQVGAHEFIMKLPGDYNFNVKERGSSLSVGQRQLISFIRAYVHNPAVLILDEATSSIDSETEQLIQKATEAITKNRTSIIIAHRLSTIKQADKIIVMEKGKIIESGNHDQLLENKGQYKKLHDLQFAGVR